MPTTTDATLTESLRVTAHRLTGASQDYDPLMDRIDNARFVLLGEASHGTHEFYHERAQITQRLIEEKAFRAVAVEADCPDAYRVNGYVHAASDDVFAIEALADSMFLEDVSSWNLRDRHMVETLNALVAHLDRQGERSKLVVWAHNSHLGDARATQMSQRGELNVGQLVRERYGGDAVLVGFTTHHGTVTAASDWNGPAERKRVRPALAGSYEEMFHDVAIAQFLLTWREGDTGTEGLRDRKLERAIGVIYLPETERMSHYFWARLRDQFDAVLHFDETRAVEPLERTAEWEAGEVRETFPFGV